MSRHSSTWLFRGSTTVLHVFLFLFITSSVFDPADRVLGLKTELYLACWIVAFVLLAIRSEAVRVPRGLLVYVLSFVSIPTASIVWYYASAGQMPYEGFALLKGYLLVSLGLLLVVTRIDILPHLCAVLSLLAVSVLMLFAAIVAQPALLMPLQLAGGVTGVWFLAERDYGGGMVMMQTYFVTSPMLAISIAYYFHRAWSVPRRSARLAYAALVALSAVAMFVAGTRNNMLVALFLPLALYVLHARNRILGLAVTTSAAVILILTFIQEISTLLDPNEYSNYTKLALLQDYWDLFTRPAVLLLGQGLGAYHFWTARGWEHSISELTYLEMIRNFGLPGALIMLGLLLYPIVYAFVVRPSYEGRDVIVGYAFYLGICVSNPNLFSSMGMLILPAILANMYVSEIDRTWPQGRRAPDPPAASLPFSVPSAPPR